VHTIRRSNSQFIDRLSLTALVPL